VNNPGELPRCGVVVGKAGSTESFCKEVAQDLISIVDPNEQTRVTAIVLMCARHSQEFDEGKPLIFQAESGDRIAVQSNIQEENKDVQPAPNES